MKTKWVCPVCNTTNICEKTEKMKCFVCGSYYEESLHIPEKHDLKSTDIVVAKHGIREKINTFIEKVKSLFGMIEKDIPKNKIIDWKIEHSPSNSKEAYIKATPIYDVVSDYIPEEKISEDTESDSRSTEKTRESEYITTSTIRDELSEDIEPWSEHKVKFDFFKLRSTGCVDIKKENVHGNKCYKVLYKNGSEKMLSLASMKMLGYLVESSSEIYVETPSTDIHSFMPWSEHKIVFDTERLRATGCVKLEKTEINGNKYYKLTYRDGVERILSISKLKMMEYIRDM